ncbi:hypothetical protein BDU57DRAFT_106018 [Ampelomyces quisqualis]|uniref:Secreted protein n=1 Tax=Ampelomyces quisqualis TaxID=50730 RepID=A0A6A5Q7K3_AMPQU|nr:hypothetical protein BDU57DRAFT_106018 [Ampelomyces quisqualis]
MKYFAPPQHLIARLPTASVLALLLQPHYLHAQLLIHSTPLIPRNSFPRNPQPVHFNIISQIPVDSAPPSIPLQGTLCSRSSATSQSVSYHVEVFHSGHLHRPARIQPRTRTMSCTCVCVTLTAWMSHRCEIRPGLKTTMNNYEDMCV